MPENFLQYVIIGVGGIFAVIVVIYFILSKKMQTKETKYIAQLTEGTKKSSFNMDVFFQKFYIKCASLPVIRRYTFKIKKKTRNYQLRR